MKPHTLADALRADVEDLAYAFATKRFWRTCLLTAFGSLLFCIAINSLLIPNNFLSGGITGISLFLFYLFRGPSLGLIYWALNVPIMYLAWRNMSLRYLVISAFGVVITGVGLDMTRGLQIPVSNPILAAILAGVISGAGSGIYLRYGGSTGGMDIIATMMRRKFGVPMGISFISVNMSIVAVNALLHNVDIALYTGIYMFVHSTVVDKVQAGFSNRKTVIIVTEHAEVIAQKIITVLGRGVTLLHASGAYEKREMRVVYTVINMLELGRVKEILYEIDPAAFVSISETSEVIGNRFHSWEEHGFEQRHLHKKAS
jgi:uncharacterized membrane-anchored protein YitT (DUF2179 family)